MTGYSWRAGATVRVRSGILASGGRAVGLRALRRPDEQERQPLALGAVHEQAERVVARQWECQIPQVDRERQRGVPAVALATGHEAAGRAGDLAAIGIEQHEADLVLALGLG